MWHGSHEQPLRLVARPARPVHQEATPQEAPPAPQGRRAGRHHHLRLRQAPVPPQVRPGRPARGVRAGPQHAADLRPRRRRPVGPIPARPGGADRHDEPVRRIGHRADNVVHRDGGQDAPRIHALGRLARGPLYNGVHGGRRDGACDLEARYIDAGPDPAPGRGPLLRRQEGSPDHAGRTRLRPAQRGRPRRTSYNQDARYRSCIDPALPPVSVRTGDKREERLGQVLRLAARLYADAIRRAGGREGPQYASGRVAGIRLQPPGDIPLHAADIRPVACR